MLPFRCLFCLFSSVSASITSYAALGDSYAAGDGAGHPLAFSSCARFSDAYPIQIANSTELDISDWHFRNLACGGATTYSVLHTQVPLIGRSDVVTLQVGGNEADFFRVLNECVHQWQPLSTCEQELAKARRSAQDSDFISRYSDMLKRALEWAKVDARILVLSYAAFFNAETDACSKATFSKTRPQNYLTKERREELNDLVRTVNMIIKSTAEAAGAEYVDIDAIFEGHRFCEEGVREPNSDTERTWFFNQIFDAYEGPSVAVHQLRGQQEVIAQQDKQAESPKDFFELTRVFHPTSMGHKAIAEHVVSIITGA